MKRHRYPFKQTPRELSGLINVVTVAFLAVGLAVGDRQPAGVDLNWSPEAVAVIALLLLVIVAPLHVHARRLGGYRQWWLFERALRGHGELPDDADLDRWTVEMDKRWVDQLPNLRRNHRIAGGGAVALFAMAALGLSSPWALTLGLAVGFGLGAVAGLRVPALDRHEKETITGLRGQVTARRRDLRAV